MAHDTTMTLSTIQFTYPTSTRALFCDVSVSFPPGWTAVMGDNGIGKTTLLRIALGRLNPDHGEVTPDPGGLVASYCPQTMDAEPDNLDDFADDWSSGTLAIRRLLGIGQDWPYRFGTLSGGEAKRLQLACALAVRPDVLILDEPTNHVDAEVRGRIIDAMRSYGGIGIVVSHDVELIDAVCTRCAVFVRRHVGSCNVTEIDTYRGNYTQACEQSDADDLRASTERNERRREVARLEDVREQRLRRVLRVNAAKRQGRLVDPHDHDARDRRNGAKATSRDGGASRSYAQMDGRLRRARRDLDGIAAASKRYDGDVWFAGEASHRRELIHEDACNLRRAMSECGVESFRLHRHIGSAAFGGHTSDDGIHEDEDRGRGPALSVGPRDHIGLSGPNGSGKTSLLTVLAGHVDPGVRCMSIAQRTCGDDSRRAVARLDELSRERSSIVLQAFAELNGDPERLLSGRRPSPGELTKLELCLGIPDRPQLLILDEPTNHLDLHSKQALARALEAFPGAFIVASHDEWFVRRISTIRWTLE